MRETMLGIIFGLFVICFIAIIIEEAFLGGRRRRRLQAMHKKSRMEDKQN